MKTCIYLRKSREDLEKEKLGIDTLRTHELTLLEYSKKNNLNVVEIKKEIVSGGSLYSRPKMLELLEEIEQHKYEGVLCMDIDRLGRSGMKEQGIILETLQENNVLILTPAKIYDLNNESDMLHTDIKSFIARQELSIIKNRLKNGKSSSVKDGNYVYTHSPYGYKKVNTGKVKTLEIVEEEANTVRLIFDLYAKENKGPEKICNELRILGKISPSGNSNWHSNTIRQILSNHVYIGKVVMGKRSKKTALEIFDGKHEAIVSEEVFNMAQGVRTERSITPQKISVSPTNPFAGLIYCTCGYSMHIKRAHIHTKYEKKVFECNYHCKTNSLVAFDIVENLILEELLKRLEILKLDAAGAIKNKDSKKIEQQLSDLEINLTKKIKQQKKLYGLLEQDIYTQELFLERNKDIEIEIAEIAQAKDILLNDLKSLCENSNNKNNAKKLRNILANYNKHTVSEKNMLLKSIIRKIVLSNKRGTGNCYIEIELKV